MRRQQELADRQIFPNPKGNNKPDNNLQDNRKRVRSRIITLGLLNRVKNTKKNSSNRI
jgi:hypothetical protein